MAAQTWPCMSHQGPLTPSHNSSSCSMATASTHACMLACMTMYKIERKLREHTWQGRRGCLRSFLPFRSHGNPLRLQHPTSSALAGFAELCSGPVPCISREWVLTQLREGLFLQRGSGRHDASMRHEGCNSLVRVCSALAFAPVQPSCCISLFP